MKYIKPSMFSKLARSLINDNYHDGNTLSRASTDALCFSNEMQSPPATDILSVVSPLVRIETLQFFVEGTPPLKEFKKRVGIALSISYEAEDRRQTVIYDHIMHLESGCLCGEEFDDRYESVLGDLGHARDVLREAWELAYPGYREFLNQKPTAFSA